MTAADREKPDRRPLALDDDEGQIEPESSDVIGFVEPPPPYDPGPRKKLPAWATHLRHLRPLTLVE